MFAEVNGDRIHWTIDTDGNMEAIAEEKSIVGRFLSTKAVNTISREDVTNCYRYAEGEWMRPFLHFRLSLYCVYIDILIYLYITLVLNFMTWSVKGTQDVSCDYIRSRNLYMQQE